VINGRRSGVVLPAYHAAATLSRTVIELDPDVIDEIVLVDDASTDQTVTMARKLGLQSPQAGQVMHLDGSSDAGVPVMASMTPIAVVSAR